MSHLQTWVGVSMDDVTGCTLVAKSHKKQKIDGINVKPQQHIVTKENHLTRC